MQMRRTVYTLPNTMLKVNKKSLSTHSQSLKKHSLLHLKREARPRCPTHLPTPPSPLPVQESAYSFSWAARLGPPPAAAHHHQSASPPCSPGVICSSSYLEDMRNARSAGIRAFFSGGCSPIVAPGGSGLTRMPKVKPVAPRKHKSNTKTTLAIGTAHLFGQQCRLPPTQKKNCTCRRGGGDFRYSRGLFRYGGYLGTRAAGAI